MLLLFITVLSNRVLIFFYSCFFKVPSMFFSVFHIFYIVLVIKQILSEDLLEKERTFPTILQVKLQSPVFTGRGKLIIARVFIRGN